MTAPVSVVLPTRDRPELAEAALRSVLLQTRPVTQIVVVDDGSRDPAAVARLAGLSPVVELVRHDEPCGPGAARNTGLARARGEVLLFLDDDDLIHPRLIEDGLATLAARHDVDVVVFLYECIFMPGSVPRVVDDANLAERTDVEQRPISAFLRYTIPIQSCLVRRAAVGGARFPEALQQGEDTYFWISLAAAGRRFALDDRVYAFVRRHRGNVTRSRSRYFEDIQSCYEMLLADNLLTAPADAFLAHLKLFWFKTLTAKWDCLAHAGHLCASPRLLARETRFWLANLSARHRIFRHHPR